MDTPNVAAHLPRLAASQPEALAVAVFGRGGRVEELSAASLDALSERYLARLSALGLEPGSRCVLMVPPSLAFFGLTFACFKLGAVPVLVDPGMGLRNLRRCLREAEPEAFIGIHKAHLARRLLRWPGGRLQVMVGRGPAWGIPRLEQEVPPASGPELFAPLPSDTAAILFTSGSTGVPKGVIYEHGHFAAQVELLRQVYGIEPGERDLATFPLFALFGPALGMASVVPRMDASRPARSDPREFLRALDRYGCTNMFANPALVNLLGRHCQQEGIRLQGLRRIISAGAPASPAALARLQAQLPPDTEIHTPYGATEALPVTDIGSREILAETAAATERGAGVCVGRPVPGIELRILPISDEAIPALEQVTPLPTGELGEICVAGPVVTRSYHARSTATRLAKIREGSRIWHRMGDLGHIDAQGRLWMCGRKGHRVRSAKGELYTIPCEAVFNTHPRVFRTALVGVGLPGRQRPVLCVELEAGGRPDEELRSQLHILAQSRPHTEAIDTFLFHPGFPVDVRHNAKIFREQLSAWAARQLA